METKVQEVEPGSGANPWVAICLLLLFLGSPLLWFGAQKLMTGRAAVSACENYVLAGLRAPSTYKRVNSDEMQVDGQLWVTIVYDAENAYGVPIRSSELCKFRMEDGRAVVPYQHAPDSAEAVRSRKLDEAIERLNRSAGRAPLEREPCCLN